MEIKDFHINQGEFGINENRYKLFKSLSSSKHLYSRSELPVPLKEL